MTVQRDRARGFRLAAGVATLGLAACAGPSGDAAPPSILLVVVDTLRADHLGSYGYPRPTSPNIDAWATSGLVFERALATSPWTAPSFGSMLTGAWPARHGVAQQQTPQGEIVFASLDPGLPTLAERLTARGYDTAALVNNPFLSPEFGLDRGFGHYGYRAGTNLDIRRADEMVDLALDWIDRPREDPFFLMLHLFDPHTDYDAPEPFRGRFTGGTPSRLTLPFGEVNAIRAGTLVPDEADRAFIAAAHDEEIAFVDHELGRLRDELTRRGLLERVVVVLTADHGEEFFEHGGFEHGHALWQELLHVPLVVWGPGIEPGREAEPVSIADIAPTLAAAAGAVPPTEGDAISLWPRAISGAAVPRRALYAEQNLYGTELKTVVRWPRKLIVNGAAGDLWLFDLEANPGEQLLPWDAHRDSARQLLVELTQRVEADLAARSEAPATILGAETLEQLRSLGYLR